MGWSGRHIKELQMSWPLGIAAFINIWWTVLFAVLPWGVRPQHETSDMVQGTDPGAPVAPHLLVKALITTGISVLLWGALYVFLTYFQN
jgi:predicted secreted protein